MFDHVYFIVVLENDYLEELLESYILVNDD